MALFFFPLYFPSMRKWLGLCRRWTEFSRSKCYCTAQLHILCRQPAYTLVVLHRSFPPSFLLFFLFFPIISFFSGHFLPMLSCCHMGGKVLPTLFRIGQSASIASVSLLLLHFVSRCSPAVFCFSVLVYFCVRVIQLDILALKILFSALNCHHLVTFLSLKSPLPSA